MKNTMAMLYFYELAVLEDDMRGRALDALFDRSQDEIEYL